MVRMLFSLLFLFCSVLLGFSKEGLWTFTLKPNKPSSALCTHTFDTERKALLGSAGTHSGLCGAACWPGFLEWGVVPKSA